MSLPQCRAYEIVNSPGLDIGDVNRIFFSTDDGNALAYASVQPGDDSLGGGVVSMSLARRGANGWTSTSADPAAVGVTNSATGFTDSKVFSTDLSRELVSATLPLDLSDTDGVTDGYTVEVGTGKSTLITQAEDNLPTELSGASQDLSHVVTVGISGGIQGIWTSDGVHRDLLSVYPDGTSVGFGAAPASSQYQRGANVGGFGGVASAPFVERGGAHGISDDAQRVYFTDYTNFAGALYVRDLVASPARTLAVGVSARTGDIGTQYAAAFLAATHDGASAYFVSSAQLTDAATPGGGIYRFDLATNSVTQVTPDAGASGLALAGAIVSDDQSHIYFTSYAALEGAAQPGDVNAYVWTSGGNFRFIGKVDNGNAITRVTPDGRYALLLSSASLNGAPNNGLQALYRYDYVNNQVVCVSCRADGTPSDGVANVDAQSYGEPGAPLIRNRALTFDGQVAFTSTDRLVADDHTNASDVYLYHDGTVSLLTPGRGDTGSYVGDISDDGSNVSIMTRAPLLSVDRDVEEYDAYNVRVDGGFLAPAEPSGSCHGEDCQGPPQSPGPDPRPSSTLLTGDGNTHPGTAKKSLSFASLTSAQRATLAKTGKVVLSVRVSGGGKITLRGRGSIGGATKTVGSVSHVVLKNASTAVKLTFKLSTTARRELVRRHRLSVVLEARLSGVSAAVTRTTNLTRASR